MQVFCFLRIFVYDREIFLYTMIMKLRFISIFFLCLILGVLFLLRKQHDNTKSIVITAFGDSVTEGYGLPYENSYTAQLEALLRTDGFPRATVYNKGTSGDTSYDGLSRVDEVIAQKPDIVIVAFGANDGLRHLPTGNLRNNLLLIVTQLQSNDIVVVLAGIKPPSMFAADYGVAFQKVFAEVAKERKVTFIPDLMEGVSFHPNLTISDGLHPNKDGYTIIAKRNVLPKIVEAIGLLEKNK